MPSRYASFLAKDLSCETSADFGIDRPTCVRIRGLTGLCSSQTSTTPMAEQQSVASGRLSAFADVQHLLLERLQ